MAISKTQTPSEVIRSARQSRGLTQTQLAVAAGVGTASTISDFERGLRPSAEVAERIAAALGIDTELIA
jgi:transcriptional regulator with XRE-family HTH domain